MLTLKLNTYETTWSPIYEDNGSGRIAFFQSATEARRWVAERTDAARTHRRWRVEDHHGEIVAEFTTAQALRAALCERHTREHQDEHERHIARARFFGVGEWVQEMREFGLWDGE